MKKIVYITSILLCIPLSFAHAYTFSKPLSLGTDGEDVFQLQKLLNQNQYTQIAQEGVGSPGNETSYFGQKTKDAVIRFQNMYAQDILIPNGLSTGTGFVGMSTLTFLNTLQNQTITPNTSVQNNTLSTSTPNQLLYEGIPQFLITKRVVQPNQSVFVGSQNNLKELDFILDSKIVQKKCRTEYTCELFIPKNIESGSYKLSTSNTSWGEYQITVLDSKIKKPKVTLKKINLLEDNLIKGKYLTPNITIYTMYGIFTSQTKNNSFILKFPAESVQNATSTKGIFYIENENQLASDILLISYEI
jgi:peptidoglycan hydrolase-like protein with peptidoglycan-binding domain